VGILTTSLDTAPSLDDQNGVKILCRTTKIRARDRLVYKGRVGGTPLADLLEGAPGMTGIFSILKPSSPYFAFQKGNLITLLARVTLLEN